jgi:glycosyltransferase involved in cell wall biosynthesis
MRRILLLITDLETGGTPTVVRELATRLHDPGNGVHVEVACLSRWGPVADAICAAGVTVTALNAAGVKDLLVIRRLIRLIRQDQIDTVFSFLVHANAVAAAARPFCRRVRFIQSIQTTQPEPRWHWRLQRAVQLAAEKVVVPSQSVADAARDWSDVPPEKLLVIPNAVDPDAFSRSPIPGGDPRPYPIGFIGRLDPIKCVHYVVESMAGLQATNPGLVRFDIFGDGSERSRIEKAIARSGLQDVVRLRGWVARPQDALAELGMLVLFSKAEGFGLVLIEAMAAGVPVVATNVPGIRDVVRSGETGLLVSFPSPAEFHFAVRRMVEDRQFRSRVIENGLAEVRERFSWGGVLESYRRLLELP